MNARGELAQIGKYPVVRKLGEGATSEVYLCNDPFNLREVAVKVGFPESFRDPARGRMYRKLFLTEAKLAGKLQHPHICQIFDAVADETQHYLVMEYVDGGTLEKFCSPAALLSVEDTVEVVFNWPGLGTLSVDALTARDYPVLQGVFLLLSVSVVLANLVADLIYGILDPRVRT